MGFLSWAILWTATLAADAAAAYYYSAGMLGDRILILLGVINALLLLYTLAARRTPKMFEFEKKLKELEGEMAKTVHERHKREWEKRTAKAKPKEKKELSYEHAKEEIEAQISEAEFRYRKRKLDEATFRELMKDYNKQLIKLEASHRSDKKENEEETEEYEE